MTWLFLSKWSRCYLQWGAKGVQVVRESKELGNPQGVNLAGDLELAEEHQVPPGKHVSPSARGWKRCPGKKQS